MSPMSQRVTPFALDQIGVGVVRFSSKGVFETHKDQMVNPYAQTRIPKEHLIEGTICAPQHSGKYPAVVLLHDRWGLTTQTKDLAQKLACEGLIVLAPNLYGRLGGMVTANAEVASALLERMDQEKVLQDINACCEYLNTNITDDNLLETTHRNLHAVVGFDLGGTLALRFACQRKRLRAVVAFYGQLPSPLDSLQGAFCPIQYHAAGTDEFIASEDIDRLETFAKTSPKDIEVHRYPNTVHGFCDQMIPETYHAEACDTAWEHMAAFLKKSLSI